MSSNDSRVTITGAEMAADSVDDTPAIDPDDPAAALDRRADRSGAHRRGARSGRQRRPLVGDPGSRRGARARPTGWPTKNSSTPRSSPVKRESDDARPWEFLLEPEASRSKTIRGRGPAARAGRMPRTRRRAISSNPLAGRAVRQSSIQQRLARHRRPASFSRSWSSPSSSPGRSRSRS